MHKDYQGQRVLVIGAARQGLALARYLCTHNAQVVLNDQRGPENMAAEIESLADLAVEWRLGGHPLEILTGIDLVCPSGGVPLTNPLVLEAVQRGIPLSNDTQIFLEQVPCRVIGITGSAGKTTTTTLVGRMAKAGAPAGSTVWVGGNIGLPLVAHVDQMRPDDLVVMEVSSFQLEQTTLSPAIAAILNITPNHLDRHGTMEAYTAAKARMLQFQDSRDTAVLGRDDPGAWSLSGQVRGRLMSFGRQTLSTPADEGCFVAGEELRLQRAGKVEGLLPRAEIRLRGEHNLLNALAACTIAAAAGLEASAMQTGVAGFHGVPHRLQYIRSWHGADWYNDSIATAPERSMAAVRSFSEPLVLLAGGRDKKLPWEDFASLIHQRVDHLVIFGEAAGKITAAVGPARPGQRPYTIQTCEHLHQAVLAAAEVASQGDVVLLSPGGTSFDEFRDFEERGERFEQWVKDLS